MDAFAAIESWREWRKLLEYAHLVVLARPGSATQLPAAVADWAQAHAAADAEHAFASAPCGAIIRLELTQLAISATHIRELVAVGSSPRFLLPDVVLEYIRRHHIYQGAVVREGVND
jgi:nicotinate-nucleotide adenylyltransferase